MPWIRELILENNNETLMTAYEQTIEYLFTRLPLFSRIGAAAYKADLINTTRLCNALGNPEIKFKSVHVAGTNGKGSVSHMLAAILQTAGYKTGLYTSPHLKDFRERIKINGEMIPEQNVIDFTERMMPLIEEISPSFFEITVAMAFQYFADEKVDIAIIETGLGGRLDSTNVITPELSVITNISWDHMNILGNTLEKIASEKAGIIKSNIPVILGEVLPETKPVFEKVAAEKNAPLIIAPEKRTVTDWSWQHHHLHLQVAEAGQTDHKKYELDLAGIYQKQNLVTVLEVCDGLQAKGWKIDEDIISRSLRQVKKLTGLHGRWETIHTSPTVILDVAHNPDGINQLVQQIEITDHHDLHIVFGMVKDKDVENVITLLPREAHYYFTRAQVPRAIPESILADLGHNAGLKGEAYPEVNVALKAALEKADDKDLIIVCGSVFLVGEVVGFG
jgi:dihydrofolate synthase/folylpolyglutamate synthase